MASSIEKKQIRYEVLKRLNEIDTIWKCRTTPIFSSALTVNTIHLFVTAYDDKVLSSELS